MVRMKLTHSFFFIFLVWNLFLAIIPFCITEYLQAKEKISAIKLMFLSVIWLLFLPNSPYIVTDFFHLRLSHSNIIWLDILVVFSFALNGLLLFYFSFRDMMVLLKSKIHKKLINTIQIGVFLLTGFGVYLGRFLRYNSWEIIQNPMALFQDIFDIVLHPNHHTQAWLFTLGFGFFIAMMYYLFDLLMIKEKSISSKETIQ